MTTRASHDLVAIRAAVVTGLSVGLASLAHLLAGGGTPSVASLALMGATCLAMTALLVRPAASPSSLALMLLAAQTTLHLKLAMVTQPLSGAAGHAGHFHDTDPHLAMIGAHLVAAGLAGLVLGHAERALLAVLETVARAAAHLGLAVDRPAPRVAPRLRLPHPAAGVAVRRTSVRLADSVVRRGPPAPRAAALPS